MSQTHPRSGSRTQQRNGTERRKQRDGGRLQAPELVSFAISGAIVLFLVAALVYLHLTMTDKPALIEARPLLEAVQQEGAMFYLPIEIANRGGKAGEDVIVHLSVTHADGGQDTADVTVGFLAADEVAKAIIALAHDPREALVEVDSIGYLETS